MKRSKKVKEGTDRATMLSSAIFIVMFPEPMPVQGATISSLTAMWLMRIHKDDRSAALQNLHKTVVNMTAEMEEQDEKAAANSQPRRDPR